MLRMNKENMYACAICQKPFPDSRGISTHIGRGQYKYRWTRR